MTYNRFESSRHLWHKVASKYHEHLEARNDPFQDELNTPAIINLLPDTRNVTMLDMGCGDGRFTDCVLETHPSWHVFGFDGSMTLIQYAKARHMPHAEFFVHDVSDPYPLPDQSVSLVLSKMVFPSIIDIRPAILESWRILAPGGRLIISTLAETYYTDYLVPRFHNWLRFFERNILLDHITWPDIYSESRVHQTIRDIWEKVERNRLAVWTAVSKSAFTVPVYNHPLSEFTFILEQTGFKLSDSNIVGCTPEFLAKYRASWGDREGMDITVNMVWQKLSIEEILWNQ